jgi:NAD(P)H-hydrate repair Nnr-like enzyme with NAD(P)H-hydrate dehydratase domain
MVMLAVVIKALFQEKKLTRGFLNREWHTPPRSQKNLKKSIAMACIAGQTHDAAGYPWPSAWHTSNAGRGLSHIL